MAENMDEEMANEEKVIKNKRKWPTAPPAPITVDDTDPINCYYIAETQKAIRDCKDIYLMPKSQRGLIRGSELKAWGLDTIDSLIAGSNDKKLIEMMERIL